MGNSKLRVDNLNLGWTKLNVDSVYINITLAHYSRMDNLMFLLSFVLCSCLDNTIALVGVKLACWT